jgi:hypothetical protein
VIRLTGNDIGRLSFGEAFPADDAFVSDSTADVMEGGSARDDNIVVPLMGREESADLSLRDGKHRGEIDIGEQSALVVGLLMKSKTTPQQPLRARDASELRVEVLIGPQIEDHRHLAHVLGRFVSRGWIEDVDPEPEKLTMVNRLAGAEMSLEELQNDVGAEIRHTDATDMGEVLADEPRELIA